MYLLGVRGKSKYWFSNEEWTGHYHSVAEESPCGESDPYNLPPLFNR